jgi:hypothetical protein
MSMWCDPLASGGRVFYFKTDCIIKILFLRLLPQRPRLSRGLKAEIKFSHYE